MNDDCGAVASVDVDSIDGCIRDASEAVYACSCAGG